MELMERKNLSGQEKKQLDEALEYYLTTYENADFFLSDKEVEVQSVKTCMGKGLFKTPGKKPNGFFLFIDLNPEANWGHSCLYVFIHVTSQGYHHETHIEQASANMPPEEIWYKDCLKALSYSEGSKREIAAGNKSPL